MHAERRLVVRRWRADPPSAAALDRRKEEDLHPALSVTKSERKRSEFLAVIGQNGKRGRRSLLPRRRRRMFRRISYSARRENSMNISTRHALGVGAASV